MEMKTCNDCVQNLPLSQFWKNRHNTDGYCGRCIRCSSTLQRLKRRRKNYITYKKKYPLKAKAHNVYNNARKFGKITIPNVCQACGKTGRIVGHHHDYSFPLDVLFVCEQCHGLLHRIASVKTRLERNIKDVEEFINHFGDREGIVDWYAQLTKIDCLSKVS